MRIHYRDQLNLRLGYTIAHYSRENVFTYLSVYMHTGNDKDDIQVIK